MNVLLPSSTFQARLSTQCPGVLFAFLQSVGRIFFLRISTFSYISLHCSLILIFFLPKKPLSGFLMFHATFFLHFTIMKLGISDFRFVLICCFATSFANQ